MSTNAVAATFAVTDIIILTAYLGISYLIILKYPQPVYIIVMVTVALSAISMMIHGGVAVVQTIMKTNSDLVYGLFGVSILVGIAHYAMLMQRFTAVETFGIAVIIMIFLTPVNILLIKK